MTKAMVKGLFTVKKRIVARLFVLKISARLNQKNSIAMVIINESKIVPRSCP
jgi:hypothetical protein